MLLLNTDLWHYWPVVFILGALTVVSILILVFWAIEQREDYLKRKASTSADPTNMPTLPDDSDNFWQRFLRFIRLKAEKRESEDAEKEYKERFGLFQKLGIPILIGVLIYFFSSTDLSCNVSKSKKTLRAKKSESQQTLLVPVTSPVSNQSFDLEKQNKMGPGDRLKFDQKDPKNMLHFAPTSDTVVYTIVKDEEKTRYWSVRAWVKGDTLFENRLTSPEPYNKAKVGLSHISVDRPTTLIVWKKEVKKVKVAL